MPKRKTLELIMRILNNQTGVRQLNTLNSKMSKKKVLALEINARK